MTAKLLIVEGHDPASDDMLTVTIWGPKCPDRGRVLKVLTHLFRSGDEWDGSAPNVRLVCEHAGELANS